MCAALILIGPSFDLVTITNKHFLFTYFRFRVLKMAWFDFIASLHDQRYISRPNRPNQHSDTFYLSVNTELTRMLAYLCHFSVYHYCALTFQLSFLLPKLPQYEMVQFLRVGDLTIISSRFIVSKSCLIFK